MNPRTRAAAIAQAQHLNRAVRRPLGIAPGFAAAAPVARCRFIAGDPHEISRLGDAIYCGEPTRLGSSYCEPHHARCHTDNPHLDGAPYVPRHQRSRWEHVP
ncbi:MAG TPA: hypothetical protein VFA50_16195 [Stellaceae bacterium]|nr:hypothetical protein [Stellaceae bacterium]